MGKLLENNWGRVRCPHCDSVIEPEKKDIQESLDDGHYMICPVCDGTIWFNDKYTEHPVISKILIGPWACYHK